MAASGCGNHTIFKEKFVVWQIVFMMELRIVVFAFLSK